MNNKKGIRIFEDETPHAILKLDLPRSYQYAWLYNDLIAGFLVFTVTVPSALAYGEMAGLRAANGLYACLIAMGIYGVLGTSRQLIIGAEAAVAILVASSLASAGGSMDPGRFAALAMLEALMVGVLQVVGGLSRVGFISNFVPRAVISGFLNGVALIIIIAQVGAITGIKLHSENFFSRLGQVFTNIGHIHYLTLIIGVGSILLLLVMQRLIPKLPEAVLMIVLTTLAVIWWDLGSKGVKLIGEIPPGLPKPSFNINFSDVANLFPISIGLALTSFIDVSATGRAFAVQGGYQPDPDQELVAVGVANMGCGLFNGFVVGASHSRTAVNALYKGRTQFASLLAAVFLGVFVLFFTDTLKHVPVAALGAIIVVAGFQLFDFEAIRKWRTQPNTASVSAATTLAILLAGLMVGILVMVVFAILLVLNRLAKPHETIITTELPGLLVYRFGGPLFFFNAAYFAHQVQQTIDRVKFRVNYLLVNAEAMVDMDEEAAMVLGNLHEVLKSQDITLGVCEVKGNLRKVMEETHLPDQLGVELYDSVSEAVRHIKQRQSEQGTEDLPKEPEESDSANGKEADYESAEGIDSVKQEESD